MEGQTSFLALFCTFLVVGIVSAANQKDPVLQCGGCLAMMEELQLGIANTDQKKTLQVGSYRINPDGTQNLRQVKYATSELNIIELTENVCSQLNNYGKTTNDAGESSIIKTQSEPGKPMSLKNMEISGSLGKGVKAACESLLEDYEDELIKVLQNEEIENQEKAFCVDVTGYCDADAVERKRNAKAESIRLGLNEELTKGQNDDDEDEWEEDEDYDDEEDDEGEDGTEEEGKEENHTEL